MDRQKFAAAITTLSQTLPPGRPITPAATEGYWIGLKDLTDAQLEAATSMALRSCRFMPSPRELRDFVELPLQVTAAMEWQNVRETMDGMDIYGSPDFGPLVNAIVHNLGGWQQLCERTLPELVWIRKDFERLHEEFKGKDHGLLRGSPHVGQFREPPRWCGLGAKPQAQLPSPERARISDFVRDLADSKSFEASQAKIPAVGSKQGAGVTIAPDAPVPGEAKEQNG